jgi:hypothetical protein
MMLVAVMLATMSGAAPSARDDLRARIDRSPHDVATFIDRRIGCNHWGGEGNTEYPERERQVRHALAALRCDRIDGDERALRMKYRRKPQVLELLSETESLLPPV